MRKIKRPFVLLFAVTFLLSSVCSGFFVQSSAYASVGDVIKKTEKYEAVVLADSVVNADNSASDWAIDSLEKAQDIGLTYPDIMNNFGKDITRQEFCMLSVKLYEKLTGKTETTDINPFSDTQNPEIIKAYKIGIVLGTAPGIFSPNLNITRQEICTMFYRALDKSIANLNKNIIVEFPFSDAGLISDWAIDGVKFLYYFGIIKGIGNNLLDPLSNTTREQAIVLTLRTYETFKNISSNISKAEIEVNSPESGQMSEYDKFKNMNFSASLAFPVFNQTVDLFISTEEGRPSKLPSIFADEGNAGNKYVAATPYEINNSSSLTLSPLQKEKLIWNLPKESGPYYSNADSAAFIDQNGDKVRWFACKSKSSNTAKIVWQVSRAPFSGFETDWKKPTGLVLSGEVGASQKEFSVDFSKVTETSNISGKIFNLNLNGLIFWNNTYKYKEIPKSQKKYFVRAVAVDSFGNCIGDPGSGISVIYGQKSTAAYQFNKNILPALELWTTMRQGTPEGGGVNNKGYSGEFPNKVVHIDSTHFEAGSKEPLWFEFSKFDSQTKKIVLQVSSSPYTTNAGEWDTQKGLVYTKTYDSLPVKELSYWENIVPVDFNKFAPDKSLLKPEEYMYYYIRVVALNDSNSAAGYDVSFSEVIKVSYGYGNSIKFFIPQDVKVNSYVPEINIKKYKPVQWENSSWAHYYYVFREPKWYEINCTWRNSQTGEKLKPYVMCWMENPKLTPDEYEKNYIPKVLKVGTKAAIWPKEENKSWWGELWDSIVDFFNSLVDLVKGITNWVSNAYSNLKTGLINFVADALPIPDSLKGPLKQALTALVDYGLMSMGIPPTLPNFDQLCNASLDYMAEVALTEAGIPSNEITKDLIEQTAKGIGDEMAKVSNSATPNPIDSPFLKADPDKLYRPAYLDIEISNPYDKPSLPGSFNIDAEWEWREDVTFQSSSYDDGLTYALHFIYGLSRGHNGYPIYYPVFEPVRGQPIPALLPGEKRNVRIYLKEYVGKPYPFASKGDSVTMRDFENLYWGKVGKVNFRVYTDKYSLPNPRDAALAQGFKEDSDHMYNYFYDRQYGSSSFLQEANKEY